MSAATIAMLVVGYVAVVAITLALLATARRAEDRSRAAVRPKRAEAGFTPEDAEFLSQLGLHVAGRPHASSRHSPHRRG
jgi:hypothetical protein